MSNIKANDKKWIGQQFGKLTVIEPVYEKNRWLWKCKCDCGNETIAWPNLLIRGKQKSCHCGKRKAFHDMHYVHGESHTRLNHIWSGMKKRCDNKNCSNYRIYGGRGIKYCKEWGDYLNFREWALQNGYSDNLTLERIDVDGDYCPENCTWITLEEQAKNKRDTIRIEINGETKCLKDWCKIYGKNYSKVYCRIFRDQMEPIRALIEDRYDYGYAICDICGAEFKKKERLSKYCSKECKAAGRRKAYRIRQDKKKAQEQKI